MKEKQKSIYDVFKYDLADMNLMTEFLEACDWDEDTMDKQLKIAKDCLECHYLTPSLKKYKDFEDWLDQRVVAQLLDVGLTKLQAEILKKSIINSMNEMMYLDKLEDN